MGTFYILRARLPGDDWSFKLGFVPGGRAPVARAQAACPVDLELVHQEEMTERRYQKTKETCRAFHLHHDWYRDGVMEHMDLSVGAEIHDLMSPSLAADFLGLSLIEFNHQVDTLNIPYTTTPGGHRRFSTDDLEAVRPRLVLRSNSITF